VEAGAAGVVASRDIEELPGVVVYRVEDTLVALGRLARHRRRALGARVIGITGSAGKTTTKELVRAAIATTFRVHANRGNLNNRVGLPLTLLETPQGTEVVVLEMGTNEPGEIAALTEIAEPDMAVLSTVAEAHLEKLGDLEGVYEEKLALLKGLVPDAVAVVGDAPRDLPTRARRIHGNVRVAGWSDLADDDLRPLEATPDAAGRYTFGWAGGKVRLRLPGRHAVQAALLAFAVATALGVSPQAARAGVEAAEPVALRGEIRALRDLTLIVDCYNANPASVAAGMDLLSDLAAVGSRIAFLGSMLELGQGEATLHARSLEDALAHPVDVVVATGLFARAAQAPALALDQASGRLLAEEDPLVAYDRLREQLKGDETILLKGSRGVALERLLPRFEADFGEAVGGQEVR
jgi:UDP-N-acetylmuramoyl-tripeptide--D-alanyl-D-alanine ligase